MLHEKNFKARNKQCLTILSVKHLFYTIRSSKRTQFLPLYKWFYYSSAIAGALLLLACGPASDIMKNVVDIHRQLYKGIGMLKLEGTHRQTGETYVDPTAKPIHKREKSDF